MPIISNELDELYAVADDHEVGVLDELRRRAGQTWDHPLCWTNMGTSTHCEECGKSRREIEEE